MPLNISTALLARKAAVQEQHANSLQSLRETTFLVTFDNADRYKL